MTSKFVKMVLMLKQGIIKTRRKRVKHLVKEFIWTLSLLKTNVMVVLASGS
jgi:hypothetical protein